MDKDADAYRTISEVAEALAIPPHVLRFWESKFPQIRPLKRGGGRRYYRRSDTETLRTIRRLLHEEGYTIRGVQRLLRSRAAGATGATASDAREAEAAAVDDRPAEPLVAGASTDGTALDRLRAEIAACRATLASALA